MSIFVWDSGRSDACPLVLLAVLIGLPLVGIDLTTLWASVSTRRRTWFWFTENCQQWYCFRFYHPLDRSIRIGNIIAVGGERGEVTQITTRYTVLEELLRALRRSCPMNF